MTRGVAQTVMSAVQWETLLLIISQRTNCFPNLIVGQADVFEMGVWTLQMYVPIPNSPSLSLTVTDSELHFEETCPVFILHVMLFVKVFHPTFREDRFIQISSNWRSITFGCVMVVSMVEFRSSCLLTRTHRQVTRY